KPANLFLTHRRDGTPCIKVLDFGVSKYTGASGEGADIEATGMSDIIGTPAYMSPEQIRSPNSVDARSDVWSLGVILYRLLTGRLPFPASSAAEVFELVLDETKSATPPSQFRSDIPEQLEATILRCLEKEARRRYSRVTDLFMALV